MQIGKPIVLIIILGVISMIFPQEAEVISDYAAIGHVKEQIQKFAPVEISYDQNLLSEKEQKALIAIVKAAKYMDQIFLQQVYEKNEQIKSALQKKNSSEYRYLLDYFTLSFGPFDRLDQDKPFINLAEQKPAGANFYPPDLSKEEYERWIENNPGDKSDFMSNFTIIRRQGDKLIAVPYSEVYKKELTAASNLLKEAADLVENPSLNTFLNSRAEAFLSNDYFQSDMDWMDLKDHPIEVVIGPYEVYEDELFGYKASFEAFVTLVDPVESEKLRQVNQYLEEMENNLPLPTEYKNTRRGSASPIVVVQEVFTAGDTKAGVQTTAFNLPNDERVREAKGSKKVMLKNVAQAKFEKCWIPIVNEVIDASNLPFIKFDAYFNHVLMHEMSHGMGPGIVIRDGQETSVGLELKETYPTIEEAKADLLGLLNTQFLIDKKFLPDSLEKQTYVTYLGGIFRSVRFGITSAHGGANIIEYNFLKERGGFIYDETTQKFRIDMNQLKIAVKELAAKLLLLQAELNYSGAVEFIEKYRHTPDEIRLALERLSDVPVDIRPVFSIEKQVSMD
ncbi:MAG: peptidase [bacterium]|nr:MAG: peptidase [bacterium]